MKLKTLIQGLKVEVRGKKEVDVTGISSDSRTVSPGNLFIAKKGLSFDGSQFIPQALNAGASVIVTDIYDPFLPIPQVITHQSIESKLAARYYGDPSKKLFVVGVTGSKGKTTTTYLIKHILEDLDLFTGLIGGVETIVGENRWASSLTTHDVVSNHKWLKEMVQKGCKGAVIEVSSHGLHQGRVDEVDFDLGVFTNLIPDHLDYHGTMEEYAAAKRKLFAKAKKGIFNADSPWKMGEGLTFGVEKGDVRAEEIVLGPDGTEFRVAGVLFKLPLIGKFNVYNALASIAVGIERGAKLETLSDSLGRFTFVPGRMERIGNVFVDFSHTGESLEMALCTLKEIAKGKVIVVFGGAGDRDPSRRMALGRAAAKWADISIITNDNPRKEDPEEIAKQVAFQFQKPPFIELDRRKAIEMAMQLAGKDDLVLIAGKGHQREQIFAHHTIPFDDIAVVKEILSMSL